MARRVGQLQASLEKSVAVLEPSGEQAGSDIIVAAAVGIRAAAGQPPREVRAPRRGVPDGRPVVYAPTLGRYDSS